MRSNTDIAIVFVTPMPPTMSASTEMTHPTSMMRRDDVSTFTACPGSTTAVIPYFFSRRVATVCGRCPGSAMTPMLVTSPGRFASAWTVASGSTMLLSSKRSPLWKTPVTGNVRLPMCTMSPTWTPKWSPASAPVRVPSTSVRRFAANSSGARPMTSEDASWFTVVTSRKTSAVCATPASRLMRDSSATGRSRPLSSLRCRTDAGDRNAVLKALEQVIDPELQRPVTELDMVRAVEIADGIVSLEIVLTIAGCPLRQSFEQQVEQALSGIPGVRGVALSFGVMTAEERQRLTTKLRGGATEDKKIRLNRDTRVIAVASGKGGVGKSSLSANLAVAFSQLGRRTGILDADIYGHSIPHILGIHQKPVAVDQMIVPPVKDGLKLMSIGFFLDGNEPVMWRGPMLHKALEQFLTDVHWGDLDILVVDMPPGTGDVSISLGQLLPRAEVVVVTTPQKLAQDVASRAASMAQKTNMRLLGVIENMSGDVFGVGGGEELAADLGIPLLGTVPLDPVLREQGDLGVPVVAGVPEAESARAIVAIAEAIDAVREPGGI